LAFDGGKSAESASQRFFEVENWPAWRYVTPRVECLIDKQGCVRARWLPAENDAWRNLDRLFSQVELLRKERPRAPAPDDHVHWMIPRSSRRTASAF
jgi:hypothetical protein